MRKKSIWVVVNCLVGAVLLLASPDTGNYFIADTNLTSELVLVGLLNSVSK